MSPKNRFRPGIESLESRALLSTSPAAIPNYMTHSPEYLGEVVQADYARYLGRTAGPSEVNGWVVALEHGMSDEQAEASFIAAPEYIQNHGGIGAGWVQGMYHNVLGRTPAQNEVNGWDQALAHGASPASVALGFTASAERESERVTDDYKIYLGRNPGASEVNGWVNAARHGDSNENIVAGFVGSAENHGRFGSNADWLANAYVDVLGRKASVGEIKYWLGANAFPAGSQSGAFLTSTSTGTSTGGDGKVTPPEQVTGAFLTATQSQVLQYAEAKLGSSVGNGQCADLAVHALDYAGANNYDYYGNYGPNYVWGKLVDSESIRYYGNLVEDSGIVAVGNVKPGDIIQFSPGSKITEPDGSYQTFGDPSVPDGHTAIIEKVQGSTVTVLQQNVNGEMWVQEGTFNLNYLTQGDYWIYQPIPSANSLI